MLQVYKKVEKSLDNLYGVIPIQNLEELDKPFLLCLSAQDCVVNSIFGVIKAGARVARVNTTDEMAAGFKIDEFPIAFLGVRFEPDKSYKKNYEEIVDSLIYPYLVGDGSRKVEEIKKIARKMNFMTYCDGTSTYLHIEKRLEEKLQKDGYLESDISEILSQMSLIAIGTMVDTSYLKSTTVAFINLNDSDLYLEKRDKYKRALQKKQLRSGYGHLNRPNNLLYIFEGHDVHDLKYYLKDDNIVKPAISSVLAYFLQNSIVNEQTNVLVPISSMKALGQLRIYGDGTKDPKFLLKKLDDTLSYEGAVKYTPEEAKMRQELDMFYKKNRMYHEEQLEALKKKLERKTEELNSTIQGTRKYNSDTILYQILVSEKMCQSPPEKDVQQEDSDKVVREAYNQMLTDELQNRQRESGPKL